MLLSERVSNAYDTIAPVYAVRNAAMPEPLVDLGHRLLARLGPTAHVIDVGCGAGRDMAWLEAHGVLVTGVDLSLGMLREARSRAHGALVLMDMRMLAFHSGYFAAAWCMASLLHLPKGEASGALSEMRRVLQPGGLLVLGLQVGTGERWEPCAYHPALARFFARYTVAEVDTLLEHAGFAVIHRATDGGLRFLATVS